MGKAFNRPLITFEENWHTILFSGLNQFVGEEVNDYFLSPHEIRGNKDFSLYVQVIYKTSLIFCVMDNCGGLFILFSVSLVT
jgi:hypothetical protein